VGVTPSEGAYTEVSAMTSGNDVEAASALLLSPELAISNFPSGDSLAWPALPETPHADSAAPPPSIICSMECHFVSFLLHPSCAVSSSHVDKIDTTRKCNVLY
jgi:hypothetical protein